MKTHIQHIAIGALLTLAMLPAARAFTAAEDFDSYTAPTTFTNNALTGAAGAGAAGDGWLNGWRTSTSTGLAQSVGVVNNTPVNSGGNYLSATITTKSDGTGKDSTSVARAYDAGGVVGSATELTIGFDFRVDSIDATNMRYDLFENETRATGATSASYNFRAIGGVWNYFDGESLVATTMSFNAGVTYSFSIVLDTVNSTYAFSIDNGTTSVVASDVAFRTAGFATDTAAGSEDGRWLTFNANENNNVLGQSTTFSLDNISISTAAVPEPASAAFLAGLVMLGLASLRRRRATRG